MRRGVGWTLGLSLGLVLVICSSSQAFGLVEAGLGIVVPGTEDFGLTTPVFVPRATLGLGSLGVGLDLWISPGSTNFMLLPFLQLEIPLILLKIYGGIAPIFLGSSTGLHLLPPTSAFAAKVGLRVAPLVLIGFYGEVVFGISPPLNISSASPVIGVSLGF